MEEWRKFEGKVVEENKSKCEPFGYNIAYNNLIESVAIGQRWLRGLRLVIVLLNMWDPLLSDGGEKDGRNQVVCHVCITGIKQK